MVSRHTGPLDTRDKAYLLVLRDPNLCPGPELLLGGFSSGLCGGSHSERQAEEKASGRASPGSEVKAAGGAAEAPSNPEWSMQRCVETPHRHFTFKVLCAISLRSTENPADQCRLHRPPILPHRPQQSLRKFDARCFAPTLTLQNAANINS